MSYTSFKLSKKSTNTEVKSHNSKPLYAKLMLVTAVILHFISPIILSGSFDSSNSIELARYLGSAFAGVFWTAIVTIILGALPFIIWREKKENLGFILFSVIFFLIAIMVLAGSIIHSNDLYPTILDNKSGTILTSTPVQTPRSTLDFSALYENREYDNVDLSIYFNVPLTQGQLGKINQQIQKCMGYIGCKTYVNAREGSDGVEFSYAEISNKCYGVCVNNDGYLYITNY